MRAIHDDAVSDAVVHPGHKLVQEVAVVNAAVFPAQASSVGIKKQQIVLWLELQNLERVTLSVLPRKFITQWLMHM